MRASEFITERKKKRKKPRWAAYGPGPYGGYGYAAGYSGAVGGDSGGGVGENFADGKKPGRKGLAKRSGVNTKASVSSLRKTAKNSSGEKQRMAHWLANMKAGRAKKNKQYIMKIKDILESATAGATSSGSIATVANPHISPGKARGKKSYIGEPGGPGGSKAPPQPKPKKVKPTDNALDMKTSLFGEGNAIKR